MRDWGKWFPILALLAVGLFAAAPVAAQTGSVTGTILDASSGMPLNAVQVSLETVGVTESTLGGLTQQTGRFLIINVPAGQYVLRAQLLGFGTQTQVVDVIGGEAAVVDLRLEPQAISLSEIVVTGVAGATQRTKLPFDVAQVNVADLPIPSMNAAQSIQGKVAGATVVMGSGRPGAPPSILLRGVTSLDASGRDQEPLYIVDGVILGTNLVDLDALNIMSIEVVKGAAAASLYGSRAANGVIQIRTKRGAEIADDQVRYTARMEYGGSELAYTPDALLAKKHEFTLNAAGTKFLDQDLVTECDWLQCDAPQITGADAWDTYKDQLWPGTTYDQINRFFTNGNFLQSSISAEGRSGRTNFHVSASHLDQEGIMIYTPGFKRTNFRVNVDQQVVDNLTLQTSVFYSTSSQGRPSETSGATLFDLTRTPAGVDLLADDPDEPGELMLLMNPTDSESDNPLYTLKNYKRMQWRSRFLGSANARYSPTEWLKVDGNVSFDRYDTNSENFREKGYRTYEPAPSTNVGTLYKYAAKNEALNASVTASTRWEVKDGIWNSTQVRYLYENEDYEWFDTYGFDFAVARVPTFDNIDQENITADSYLQTIRADGYFLITNWDIYDKYVVDALIRNDGSSLFGEDERRQWYYRIGGAWRISQEDFFNIDAVDELKFRYSLGTAGGRPRFSSQYEVYNVSGGRISPVSLGNKDLKPEFSTEHETGFDLSLFDYKAILSLTYAQATTEDQILPVPQPSYTGFTRQWRNAGTIESKSFEASLDLRLVERGDFSWSAKFLYDRTRSEITHLNVPAFTYGVSGQGMGEVFYAREGEQVGSFYGLILAKSCDQLPTGMPCDGFEIDQYGFLVYTGGSGFGTPQWGTDVDVGGTTVKWGTPIQGECTDNITGERTDFCLVGNTLPEYNARLSTNLSWKGVNLYALLDRSAGFNVYNQPLEWGFFKRMTGLYDQDADAPVSERKPLGYFDAWYGAAGGLAPDNEFVEDGSFTKLREISLSYRLPADFIASVPGFDRFSSIGMTLTGRNLYTWTDYRGYDPEIGKTGGDTGSAAIARVDGYTYPNFRTYTASLQFIF